MATLKVAYWQDGEVVVLPYGEGPLDGVLWVEGASGVICGHDHYWVEEDGSIGYADHHDYDARGWPVIECELPDDGRLILNGRLLSDEMWQRVRPW